MPDTWKLLIYVVAVVVFFTALFSATDGNATGLANVLRLDAITVQRGYTVMSTDRNFLLPVTPKFFQNPVEVKVENLIQGTALPENLLAVSSHYLYDIKKNYTGFLTAPMTIGFLLDDQFNNQAQIYFYDRAQLKWRELPTTINSDKKMVLGKTIFPFAEVVVAIPNKNLEPQVVSSIKPDIKPEILVEEDSLTAAAAIVTDQAGNIIFAKNIDEVRSIASLSKLITAEVFLQNNPGWGKRVIITESDNVGGASINFEPGDSVTVRDLFFATLTGSKNNAARALMRSTGLSEPQFIMQMNQLVKRWGLINTFFVEPTGLSEKNVSTAREMMEISRRCLSKFDFLEPTTIKWYEVKYWRNGELKNYWVRNTNLKLLESELYVTGGKTGYTDEAGYNLVTKARATRDSGREMTALVMGAKISMNYEEVYQLLKRFL